ncbi:LamG-like jellyroll fold domain-containing protein [Gimesia aquarii]|uniref:LamG-like jellyroll fold domain-containing protein n=1 Tax=Gimesia aquarii TaxID=2527964 RepID=A0A517VU11_9PLAN|nr:LamG-like jellyroll fold domain-containing protein [Gimesia aquarii]QDT96497.1 hypothetical protein V144x_19540 [Gimesia aquarii]
MSFRICCFWALLFVCCQTQLTSLCAVEPDKADEEIMRHGLKFDGKNSYVSVPHIQFEDHNAITVEAWVKDWSGRVFCQGKQGDPENSIWISIRAKGHSAGWESDNGTNYSVPVEPNSSEGWDHIALVYVGLEQIIYLNGKQIHKMTAPKPGPFDRNRKMIIGAQEKWEPNQPKPAALFGKGVMRLFRISNVSRYTTEFDPAETFKPDDDTVVLFNFVPSSDKTKLIDASKHQQHGTIHDAKWVILKNSLSDE